MRKLLSMLLSLAMLLTMLPTAVMAAGSTIYVGSTGSDQANGTIDAPVETIDRALELAADGDTICIVDSADSGQPAGNVPLYIDKNVTITGGTLSNSYAGIVLGADVTFENVLLAFASRVRNAIMANGHTLTLIDTTKSVNVKNTVHLFCGALTGYAGYPTGSGDEGKIILRGSTSLGNIYAGSISADGNGNAWDKPSEITFDSGFTGSTGDIYACGALETYVSDANMLDPNYEVAPPTPDTSRYTVTGDVTINLNRTPTAKVTGTANTTVNLSADQYAAAHTLTGIGDLVLAEGASLTPSAQSDLTDANVTVPATAKLDLSSMGDEITIGDFTGGGTLAFASGQMLTITGAVNGTTSVEASNYGEYITAEKSVGSSFAAAEDSDLILTRKAPGVWSLGPTPLPIKTFTLSGASAQTTDASADLSAEVSFSDPLAEWQYDVLPVDFTVTVNSNPAPYDDAASAYVDKVTGFAIYPSGEDEYFVVEFPETGAVAGEYKISVTIPAESSESGDPITATATLTVSGGESEPVDPADPEIIVEPIAKHDLVYNGGTQPLVREGEVTGGTVLYSTDGKNWGEEIPTAKNAGTYTVYWKVSGDEGFNDYIPTETIEATIEKAVLTITPRDYLCKVGDSVPDLTAEDAYTIEGFVSSDTEETAIKGTVTLSFDETPDMTETGYYFISVNEKALSADNYEINCWSGELSVVDCVHSFTDFTLGTVDTENDSVFARCSEACAEYGKPAWVLSLLAPKDAVYAQGDWHTAALSYDSQLSPEPDPDDIIYSAEPVDAGTYMRALL